MEEVPQEVREGIEDYVPPEFVTMWWVSAVPALDFLTPKQVWKEDPEKVRQLIAAYGSGAYM